MTPESWSIKDVAEHLAIAEPQVLDNLESSMKEPVKAGWKPTATDEQMLWYGIDRSNRQKTGEARVPHGTVPIGEGVAGVVPQAARDDARDGEGVAGGLPRPAVHGRRPGRLPVVPDDLDALAAAHPADPRDQGARELSRRSSPVDSGVVAPLGYAWTPGASWPVRSTYST